MSSLFYIDKQSRANITLYINVVEYMKNQNSKLEYASVDDFVYGFFHVKEA
ncbi:hypothetical protein SpAn4DRAFT_2362 [Sporomusa ovata]|uniref:Uncharacterized protein n=1 Tax=Sporomusa ovata TaxID=2378 RepID=A0A0U1L0C9_9FIRM|nr:hypothetical protein SpAn4DRAFT_2362 [Sporomusa ovata]